MILYRPMDIEELRLAYEMSMKGFPPRKPEQPIFYPVLDLDYASEIARRWNAGSPSAAGYVARFAVDDGYATRFEPQKVGAAHHIEFWVPSEELRQFNDHILPPVVIARAYFGSNFQGYIPQQHGLRGKHAADQFITLAHTLEYSAMDFRCEIAANHAAVFLNYAFWVQTSFSNQGVTTAEQQRVLANIQRVWADAFPNIKLPLTGVAP